MESIQVRSLFMITAFMSALGFCLPIQARNAEKALNRRMRVQIRADIKAQGQAFSGPEVVPPAFLKAVEGKRLVGLGEGTHGTAEIQTLHGNIILALAQKGRVLVFLEDQFGSVAPINDFVQGVGTDADLIKEMGGLYGVHRTLEFENFFRKVRAFNASAPISARIEIYGVDDVIWPGPPDPTPALLNFSDANHLSLDAQLAICASYIRGNPTIEDPKSSTPEARTAFVIAAAHIRLAISGIASSVPGKVEAAVMANNLIRFIQEEEASFGVFGGISVNEAKDGPTNTIIAGPRDSGMAENIKLLMDAKIPTSGTSVFWAHNAHIGRISYLDGDPNSFPSTWGSVGSILSTWLRDAYFPLATMTGVGTFRAHYMDAAGAASPFQSVSAPTILPDCLNVIATGAFPSKPVFFRTTDVSLMGFTRPEFAVAGLYMALHPSYFFIQTVPGMAYAGVISFPVSTAAHDMKP